MSRCTRDQRDDHDDEARQAEQRSGQRHDEMKGQRPDTDAIVQVGIAPPPRSAPSQPEGVLEDAPVREDAGAEAGEQHRPEDPDQIAADRPRYGQVEMEQLDEGDERRGDRIADPPRRIYRPFGAGPLPDREDAHPRISLARHPHDQVVVEMFGACPGERAVDRRCQPGRRHAPHDRRMRALPPPELVDEHDERAGQADRVQDRAEGQAEPAMAA
jgi:hypothetical protein